MSDLIGELDDNHSRFVPPENMAAEFGVDTSASGDPLPGTGLVVWPAKEDEQLMVWYVCDFGAAAEAGLKRGDVIQAIDGEPVEKSAPDWARSDYRPVMFGNGGDEVTLTIQQGPDSEPRDFTLALGGYGGCDGWVYGAVNADPYIGYLRIPDFDGNAEANILEALRELEADVPLDGLILDVRHNPGGNSDTSIAIFTQGVVGTTGPIREDKVRTLYRIRGPVKWNETTPVVVLTDGSSHSAADYFPAAMQELGRATIIGMPSAGNTEAIISFNLADGTLIRLAISTLLLNDGTSLEGVGVIPDVEVPLGDWGLRQEPFDVQLQTAIDHLIGQ
jgi:C-terminal peptidase prc